MALKLKCLVQRSELLSNINSQQTCIFVLLNFYKIESERVMISILLNIAAVPFFAL